MFKKSTNRPLFGSSLSQNALKTLKFKAVIRVIKENFGFLPMP